MGAIASTAGGLPLAGDGLSSDCGRLASSAMAMAVSLSIGEGITRARVCVCVCVCVCVW